MKKTLIILGIVALALSCTQNGIDNPEISIEELNDHISFLASDSLKGRKPGTAEGKISAEYIAKQFKSFGYNLISEDGFQYFDVITGVVAGEGNALSFDESSASLNEDFIPFNFSANGSLEAEVIFCGFGFDINKKGLSWIDYKDIDVNGKWVMILRADPELDNDESLFIPYSSDRDKVLTAKDKGAAGVLLVSGVEYDKKDELAKLVADQMGSNSGIPAFHITRSFANEMLNKSGNTIEKLEANLIKERDPKPFSCDIRLKGTSEIEFKKVETQNVLGFLEGNDPLLKDEILVIGGHYDHLGFGGPNSGSRVPHENGIHYGADDNASGIASIIEIAEKLAANKKSLKRSVLVMAFGAEEMGLLGSKHFTSNPLVELKKIVAVINVDMVGRMKESKELMVGGTGTSVEAEELLNTLVEGTGLKLAMSPNGFGPSDHASFYVEEISVFFFSTGAHEDYHTPRDVIGAINFEGLKLLDDFIYELSVSIVTSDSGLTFQEAGPMQQNTGARRRSGVTLGIMPSFTDTGNQGLGVDGVTPGKPAYLGGIKKGDVIIAIEGKEVTNIYDYMARMNKLDFGQTITVDVMRDGEKQVFLIQLDDK
ncbi:MAG: M20/M25/M40 family metallo-hydrolase [Bacteroidota bacterium]|nr:M20/M25/M40 family metallo-hydrolase [Bacteroidota bacterium]